MRYFKGSRRNVKKSSHSVKDDASASKSVDSAAVDSSVNGRTQRKRPHISDNTEMGQTKRSKKSKQSSSSKNVLATRGHGHATNKKDTKTSNDNDQPTNKTNKRKKQVIPTESLSSSESEGSLNLSDKSDSLHVTECNTGELGEQSDRTFLQQQIKILKTPFQLENDCPALSRMKANDSNHLPLQVIHNTLRKVNHKTEDEIMRSLNRLAQRKLLDSLSAVRPESSSTTADEQLKRYKEVQARVANLEKTHHEMIQEHAQCECIGVLVSQMEGISKEFNKKDLMDEVQKTNDFLASSNPVTTSKTQNLNNTNAGARPGVDASGYIPSTHEQLVQILFKD